MTAIHQLASGSRFIGRARASGPGYPEMVYCVCVSVSRVRWLVLPLIWLEPSPSRTFPPAPAGCGTWKGMTNASGDLQLAVIGCYLMSHLLWPDESVA